ncbi:MAG: glycosyltransferase family 4 protein [Acidobacteria bacterium]|nr:glycosyltransferase family 4 protein [Acidobacteriota bacterium]
MRVCVDATPLLLRSAGVKNYLYYWLLHLRWLAGEESVCTFPVAWRFGSLDHQRSLAGRWTTLRGVALLHLSNRLGALLLDRMRRRADVFHASQLLVRTPGNCRVTATLYDMTCWLLPETHTRANVVGAKRFAEQVVSRADGLIAISEHTRQDAVRILDLDPQRIEVIYPGVAEGFFEVPAEAVGAVRAKYGLARTYILFVGTVEPRKNLEVLLDAYLGLPSWLRAEYDLVVAGPTGWAQRSLIDRVRAQGGGVRYLDYVPETDLPGLTAGATLFAYPSLYEGFGFPVAQAMVAGVPVVTSNVSSLPEITGGAAVLVDPRSVSELRAAMERLLLAPAEREALTCRALEVARQYHWETCARKTLAFFERMAGWLPSRGPLRMP